MVLPSRVSRRGAGGLRVTFGGNPTGLKTRSLLMAPITLTYGGEVMADALRSQCVRRDPDLLPARRRRAGRAGRARGAAALPASAADLQAGGGRGQGLR